MNNAEQSLSNLNTIMVPEPPPFWPPAPGGLILLCLVIIFLVLVTIRLYSHWHKNAYRRAGMLLLREVTTSYEISVLLKRVALAAYRRNQVASLHGSKWVAFLNRTCPQSGFQQNCFSDPERKASPEQIDAATIWIRKHKEHPEAETGS